MTRDQIKALTLLIIAQVDYDLAKSFDPDTAEEPEYIEERLDKIADVAEKFIKKSLKKVK